MMMCYQFIEDDTTLQIYKSGICKCASFDEEDGDFSINEDKTVNTNQFIEM